MQLRLMGLVVLTLLVTCSCVFASAGQNQNHKILYVDSYDGAYPWSNGIFRGIQAVLADFSDVELRSFHMDTKRKPSEAWKKEVARQARDLIEEWQPEVVIASDDNASKYLIVPYYLNKRLPFVFCGVNWSATEYGFPAANVTGMVEVQLIDQLLKQLRIYSAGERIAFIKGDDLSARKEASFYEERFHLKLKKVFVKDFNEWQQEYRNLQQDADMILLGNSSSIAGWDADTAYRFILENTQVPSGNWDDWMARYSLITLANRPEEQGEWAARTAMKIVAGTAPADISLTTNKRARIILNMELARRLKIKFPIDLIERATFTSE